MGCDIHLFVEKKTKGSKGEFFPCAFKGEFSERIYGMFAKLANVRNYHGLKHLPIRGLPKDISYKTFGALFKCAVVEYENESDEDYYYLQEEVDKWVLSGSSFIREYNNRKWYSDPDAHSINWCTPDEMRSCIDELFKNEEGELIGDYIEWVALSAYMKTLEDNGIDEVRAVYWFDS